MTTLNSPAAPAAALVWPICDLIEPTAHHWRRSSAHSPYTELMNEDTNVSGIAYEDYTGSYPVDVVVKTRKSDDLDDPRYFPESSIQQITSSGLTLTVSMRENTIL